MSDCSIGRDEAVASTRSLSPKSTQERPPASSESVRSRMSKQKRKDTQAELLVRRALHSRGVRFRVGVRPEPALRVRGDIVWRGLKLIVFIDGCFWHGCPEHATRPRANAEWWAEKLDNNVRRDRRTDADLSDRDWHVLRFWEHEDPEDVADVICAKLGALRSASRSR
ncbi:very short patch repair endonuclease [Gordonia sp. LSe1-13]|uniref:Very short patch repair endonuclease n=1 Tax=Gordonia sesuvii TaxID=3116777 RepID=A0ABU7MF93_9ACTN|nr:very short patch repair endonuclease [Gordonia sp. LSe1-13]